MLQAVEPALTNVSAKTMQLKQPVKWRTPRFTKDVFNHVGLPSAGVFSDPLVTFSDNEDKVEALKRELAQNDDE